MEKLLDTTNELAFPALCNYIQYLAFQYIPEHFRCLCYVDDATKAEIPSIRDQVQSWPKV